MHHKFQISPSVLWQIRSLTPPNHLWHICSLTPTRSRWLCYIPATHDLEDTELELSILLYWLMKKTVLPQSWHYGASSPSNDILIPSHGNNLQFSSFLLPSMSVSIWICWYSCKLINQLINQSLSLIFMGWPILSLAPFSKYI